MAKVTILGAGVMGSAMAAPAVAQGHRVALVGAPLDGETIRSVVADGWHPRLRVRLPEAVTACGSDGLPEALDGADLLVIGVSSAGVGWAVDRLAETLRRPVPVLIVTKGLRAEGVALRVFSDVIAATVRDRTGVDLPVMAVGGPCLAGELAAARATSVVIAGSDQDLVRRIVALLGAPFFRARPSSDVIGVELCAALKNTLAIGVGWAAGRLEREGAAANGAGMHNLEAGLFMQAVEELALTVEALGGSHDTVAGLAGVGDLYVTCQAGRNGRLGRLLGRGLTYRAAMAGEMAGETAEGGDLALAVAPAFRAMWADGRLPADRMPLCRAILAAIVNDEPMTIPALDAAGPVQPA